MGNFDFTGILAVAATIISIATLAGLGLQRGVVTNLREQLKDARDETAAIEKRRDRERQEYNEEKVQEAERREKDRARIAQLTADLDALSRAMTGQVHWAAIADRLEDVAAELIKVAESLMKNGEALADHNRAAVDHWAHELTLLTEIRDRARANDETT